MKILFLSQWFPSESDKMAGLFVYKHAQAVAARGLEVRVNTWWPEADVVQLNVLTLKRGMVAYVLKRVFGIPYVIIEHWSGFLPENGQYMQFPKWKRALLEEIGREASGIYPVSQKLEDAMKACGIQNKVWGRMENVVDEFFYSAKCKVQGAKCVQLLHVSCFDEAPKNVKGLLRAIKTISEKRQDICLTLVGTGKDWQMCRDYADELKIPSELLRWTGELTPQDVCREMQRADFFVLPSRWENAPVVLSECLAVGLPIVSTKAGGIPEMVNAETGVLVPPNDDVALTEAIEYMLNHHQDYDADKIREYGGKYSYERVGKKLMEIYEKTK